MNKFLFKSTEADFKKLSSSIDTIQKNVLYITYRLDKCLSILETLKVDTGVQKQVTDFYADEDSEHIPEGSKDPED